MPTEIPIKDGADIVFKSSGGDGDISPGSIADTKARESTKADFGALRGSWYDATLEIKTGGVAPDAGRTYEVWMNSSADAAAGAGNVGGASGVDQAFKDGEEEEWLRQWDMVGRPLSVTNDADTVMRQLLGSVYVPKRYNSVALVNKSGETGSATDADYVITFSKRLPESQ